MLRKEIESDHRGWQITFSDMLMLLLTFFVFIISISTFETIKYKKFWKEATGEEPRTKATSTSFKFQLIKGLKVPG